MTDTSIRRAANSAHDYANFRAGTGGTFARTDLRPEDVARWPITAAVRDAIERDYDGDLGTARDIGQRFGGYPSWHIVAIAAALGVHEPRQRAHLKATTPPVIPLTIIEPRHAPTPEPKPEPAPIAPPMEPPTPEREDTPVSTFATVTDRSPDQPDEEEETDGALDDAPEDAPAAEELLTCVNCGATFAPWKVVRGRVQRSSACRPCFSARMREVAKRPTHHAPPPGGKSRRPITPPTPVAVVAPEPPTPTPEAPAVSPRRALRDAALPALLAALPDGDTWTDRERTRWLEALVSLMDFAITATPEPLDWRAGQ